MTSPTASFVTRSRIRAAILEVVALLILAAYLFAAAFVLFGCGDDDGETSSETTASSSTGVTDLPDPGSQGYGEECSESDQCKDGGFCHGYACMTTPLFGYCSLDECDPKKGGSDCPAIAGHIGFCFEQPGLRVCGFRCSVDGDCPALAVRLTCQGGECLPVCPS